jgi:hypothetical protein
MLGFGAWGLSLQKAVYLFRPVPLDLVLICVFEIIKGAVFERTALF